MSATTRMRTSCLFPLVDPQGAREGVQASWEETSGHERSRMKTKKEMFAEVGRVFLWSSAHGLALTRTVQESTRLHSKADSHTDVWMGGCERGQGSRDSRLHPMSNMQQYGEASPTIRGHREARS